jgi:enediyne polyketide synthase
VIAGYNGPENTVVSGPAAAMEAVRHRAAVAGIGWIALQVSHAFHSPLVAPAGHAFAELLAGERFDRVERRVVSTITGELLAPDADIRSLLREQITERVLFAPAVKLAAKDVDLFVEVGPGRVLSHLAQAATDTPAVPLDTDSDSITGLLGVIGAAYVSGASVDISALFRGRVVRPLQIGRELRFLANPCESAPPLLIDDVVCQVEPVDHREPQAEQDGIELLRRLVAERTELPVEAVTDDSHLLDDLHLSSITVGHVINQAAQQLGLSTMQEPLNFATATLREVADALATLSETAPAPRGRVPAAVAAAAPWVRAFSVNLDELPPPRRPATEANGPWQLHAAESHPFAEPLRVELEQAGLGSGILVCIRPDAVEDDLELALIAAQTAAGRQPGTRFVLVQHDRGATGLAKTFRLEAPQLRITVVHVPVGVPAIPWIVQEVASTAGFAEAWYDQSGIRRVPILHPMPMRATRSRPPVGPSDVLLVTGGAKGITAECALAVAEATGVTLAILGRSDRTDDPALEAALRRMSDRGVTAHYLRADVTDLDELCGALAGLSRLAGPVTGLLHGAGLNEPKLLTGLDMTACQRVINPKITGFRTLLRALDPDQLKLMVTFGSIIGRAGLRGEAHYAIANEWLADLTAEFAAQHPHCHTLCLEWSVWSGVGMGERLAVMENLERGGITAITPDQGVEIMMRLVTDPDAPTVPVIIGRVGGADTVRFPEPELPLLRFVGTPLVRFHGVELVSEVELNAGTDPYLADHNFDGDLLFPAVIGLEAMAQVAAATIDTTTVPVIEQAEFLRAIVVPKDGSTTIRVAAAVTQPDIVEVAIRSSETGFAVEHFRARLVYSSTPAPPGPPDQSDEVQPAVALDPVADLYGSVLFQGDRFQRLRRFRRAAAREIDADVGVVPSTEWFARFLPGDLLLGDPGMRDALMHGNQVCVPNATLLPLSVDRVYPCGALPETIEELRCCATERSSDGDTYVYDVGGGTPPGAVVERWEGLRLKAVRKSDGRGPWVAALLGPYVERSVGDLLGRLIAVGVEPNLAQTERREHTLIAVGRALGRPVDVRTRADGRPEIDGATMSASHGLGMTLCVVSDGPVGCDIEAVVQRPEDDWNSLLDPHSALCGSVSSAATEDFDSAATRIWTVIECLRKAGLSRQAPITMISAGRDGWVVFASGRLRIATLLTGLRGRTEPAVVSILAERRS